MKSDPLTIVARRRRAVRGHGEDGFVVAAGAIVLLVVLTVVAAVAAQSLSVSGKSNRDPLEIQAIQAADAGLQTALYRLNGFWTYTGDPTSSTQCVLSTTNSGSLTGLKLAAPTTTVGGVPWCDPSPAQNLGNGESFSYQMTPILGDILGFVLRRRIVATGTATNGSGTRTVSARVLETVEGANFSGIATSGLVVQTAAAVNGGAQVGSPTFQVPIYSNGSITVTSGATQCGPLYYISGSAPLTTTCAGNPPATKETSPFTLLQPQPPSSNNNDLLETACDTSNRSGGHCTYSSNFLSGTGTFQITKGTVILGPGTYSMCSLTFNGSGGTLQLGGPGNAVTPTNPITIYIPPPGACGSVAPLFQVNGSGSIVDDTSDSPPSGGTNSFYLEAGGACGATDPCITVAGNSASTLAINIIAPQADVTVGGTSGSTVLEGGVEANTITMAGSARFNITDPNGQFGPGPKTPYTSMTYTECSATAPPPGSAPDQNC